jgi:hypothetical protein
LRRKMCCVRGRTPWDWGVAAFVPCPCSIRRYRADRDFRAQFLRRGRRVITAEI